MESLNSTYENILKLLTTEQDIESFTNYLNSYLEQREMKIKKKELIQVICDDFIEDSIIYYCKTTKIFFYYDS